jgi:type 1 glutamine amidotransferase
MAGIDALVLYDMPGLDFGAASPPSFVEPDADFKRNFLELLDRGIGIVALHHAIAGWPAWEDYAELLGGRFLYRPGILRGAPRQDSGYRHDVVYDVVPADPENPILQGVEFPLHLTDELYLSEVFEDSVRPLLRAEHAFTRDGFYSAAQAVDGRMFSNEGWSHPDGSNLVGWTKRARNSPLVYLQPGDGPATYAHPGYRRLIANAIRWVASPQAKDWARASAA